MSVADNKKSIEEINTKLADLGGKVNTNTTDIEAMKKKYDELKFSLDQTSTRLDTLIRNDELRLIREEERAKIEKEYMAKEEKRRDKIAKTKDWAWKTVIGAAVSIMVLVVGIVLKRAYNDYAGIYDHTKVGLLWGEGPLNH